MTERGLSIITVVWGNAVVANANNLIDASARQNQRLGDMVAACRLRPAGAAVLALTVTRVFTLGAIAGGSIGLIDGTRFESGTASGAATDFFIMQCRAGYGGNVGAAISQPGCQQREAFMTAKGLDILTVIHTGVAIVVNTSTAISSAQRAGYDLGQIISGYSITAAGAVTSFTVVAPGTGAPGANSIRLDSANANQIILDVGGGNLLNTSMMVLYCRVGSRVGCTPARPYMTDKGLSSMLLVYAGGDQAGGVYVGATTQAIPASMRANRLITQIITAEIHAAAGGMTELTPVLITPAGANEIQQVGGTSFIRGTATPAHDIAVTDQIFMHVRVEPTTV